MSLMQNGISRLEARVEQLVEGTFARLFADRLHPREVALQLARAMEDGATSTDDGARRAPEHYCVHLNPQDALALLEAEPDLEERLGGELIALARDGGLTMARRPEVTLVPDASLAPRAISVDARAPASPSGGDTLASTPIAPMTTQLESAPDAFLIVDGQRHVALNQPVVTIGRRLDNTLVLNDSRVSRTHAQIRQRYGRWVVFDLGSRGGTQVNKQPITECVLRPGDVISLAGVTLIYAEEERPPSANGGEIGGTRPLAA
ncbi:MAG: DUF3662 domain-containing protein [Chloroflexi bacterium]|nr:DUF3662 domain-containing protein [Chloroflexota bacterium]